MTVYRQPEQYPVYGFAPVTRREAMVFCAWRFPGIYAFYDLDGAAYPSFLNPTYRYQSIRDGAGTLLGYCCFGEDAQVYGIEYDASALDIGLAMAPSRTGQGEGAAMVSAITDFALRSYRPEGLRLTVASFNRRAMIVYERNGFIETERHAVFRRGRVVEFAVMCRRRKTAR